LVVPNGHVWLPVAPMLESSTALLSPVAATMALSVNPPPAVSVTEFSEPTRPRTRSFAFNVVTTAES